MFFSTHLLRIIRNYMRSFHCRTNKSTISIYWASSSLNNTSIYFCLFWKFALALEKPNVFIFLLFLNENYLWLRLILFVFFLFIDWWIGIANVARSLPFSLCLCPLGCPLKSHLLADFALCSIQWTYCISNFTWSSAHVLRLLACFLYRIYCIFQNDF